MARRPVANAARNSSSPRALAKTSASNESRAVTNATALAVLCASANTACSQAFSTCSPARPSRQARADPDATAFIVSCESRCRRARCSPKRSLVEKRSRRAITASAPSTITDSGSSRRETLPSVAWRTATTSITRKNAASAPATEADTTNDDESSPFTNALSRVGMNSRLLDLGSRHFYHICPFFDVLEQEGFELIRLLYQWYRPLLEPSFLYIGPVDDFINAGVQKVDDFLGRAFRGHDPEPDRCLVAGHRLGDCGQVGSEFRTLEASCAESPHLPCLCQFRHGGHGVEHHLHGPGDDAVARVARSLVRHVNNIGLAHRFEQFASHVIGSPPTGRSVV